MPELYRHQKLAVEQSQDKWGLWFRQRVGKTAPAICLANNRATSALIISPKQIKNKWISEVETWGNSVCNFKVVSKEDIRLGKNIDKRAAIIVDECFTGDTEILTEKGFIRFDKLQQDETVAQYDLSNSNISFTKPLRYIKKHYIGNLININSDKNVDILATENHEIIVKKTISISKIPIKDVCRTHHLPVCGYSSFTENHLTPLEKLLIILQADGSIHRKYLHNNRSSLIFSFSKQRKIDDFLNLMDEGKFKFNEIKPAKSHGNVKERKRFIVQDIPLASKILRDNFDITKISLAKGREIIDYMVKWDGSIISNHSYYYSSVEEDNVNFYQEVAILSGYRARKSIQIDNRADSYNDVHRLYILKNRQWQGLQGVNIISEQYDGLVYCVSVHTGNIIIRRNGKVAVVGNCHMAFGNYKSQTYKALYKYIQDNDIKYIWLLTGTPMTATNWCVFSYAKLLGRNYNWKSWRDKFNYPVKMGRRIIWQPKKGMEKELQDILKSIGTVIDLKDITYVAEDEEEIEEFKLNTEQKKLIKEYFDPLPIVRYGRQWQLESGVLKSDNYRETISIPCDKDKRLLELVKDIDKVIIVCRYHDQIDKYKELLSKLNRNIYEISGRVKRTAADIAPEAENDPSAIVICQAETYAGYDLKSFNTMIFASMSYSFVAYDQMCSRIKAIGKTIPCQYIYFITEGDSLDRAVYESVKKKQDFSIELYKK